MTDLSKLARKITWVLFANQSLTSAGFIAASTINAIIGAKLGGNASFAGVPSAEERHCLWAHDRCDWQCSGFVCDC